MEDKSIKIAIAGVGNCASSLIQGLEYYKHTTDQEALGLVHPVLDGYRIGHIKVVAAFDIDKRKVGKDVSEAVFAKPNCTAVFCPELPKTGALVKMGHVLDGVAEHMTERPADETFVIAEEEPCDVVQELKKSGAHLLINYLPVGSEKGTRFYAQAALDAGIAFVNCMPIFIASTPEWAKKFKERGLPIVGDDIKAQMGATITHRVLTKLFADRGIKLRKTYQLNIGGNTDFLNMSEKKRLASKKLSKTESVQSQLDVPLEAQNIHVGPSDYIPWLKDNKVAYIRWEASGFGSLPIEMELRLSVEDSPNSAGMVVDAVRCCKVAMDRGISGPLLSVSAYTMKRPPTQYPDSVARGMLEDFIAGKINY